MKKYIIGLSGVKESGKTTVSSILQKKLKNVKEVAIADKLKNTCAEVFNLDRSDFDDQNKKEKKFKDYKILDSKKIVKILNLYGIEVSNFDLLMDITAKYNHSKLESPRHIAQYVGTEFLRNYISPDVHCESVNLSSTYTIVPDIRFQNEFEYFSNQKDAEYIPLYIHRKSAEAKVTKDSHISEKEVFKFCHNCIKINNNQPLAFTENQIDEIIKKYIKV